MHAQYGPPYHGFDPAHYQGPYGMGHAYPPMPYQGWGVPHAPFGEFPHGAPFGPYGEHWDPYHNDVAHHDASHLDGSHHDVSHHDGSHHDLGHRLNLETNEENTWEGELSVPDHHHAY